MDQCSLLEMLNAPTGAYRHLAGVMPAIRANMNRVASEYPEGRKMLVDAIVEVAQREAIPITASGGKTITKEQLDKFLQHGERGHEPTLGFILCFCIATKDYSALEPIWKPFGLVLIPARDLPLLEYGRTCDALKKAREQKKKLEARL